MSALLIALVLTAAVGSEPLFEQATEKVRSGEAAAAVPLLQDLLGKASLSDSERALVQVWLAIAHDSNGDALRARAHLRRAVALDPQVQAPATANAALRQQLEGLRPNEPVPWLETPSGIIVVTSAATAGLAVLFAGLVTTDIVVTDMWLDDWYGSIEDGRSGAAPRAFAHFVGKQNDTYARVRETRRADLAVLAACGTVVLGASALTLAALLSPADEAE